MKLKNIYKREYRIWKALRARCNSPCYCNSTYQKKGIKCCRRWKSFEHFISDMGKCPEGYSIDRIDNNKVSQKYNISIDKINMIKDNLVNGIIDPRDNLEQIKLKSNVLTIDDLNIGDKIEGVIRNVTSFGAFVDIGLHDDALIHISKISKDYLKHPSEVLKLGDIKTFTVCAIEKDRMRVSLSLID